MLKDLGTLASNARLQYLCTIFHGEDLYHFENLCGQLGSTTKTHLNQVILGLSAYFFSVNDLSKQKYAM